MLYELTGYLKPTGNNADDRTTMNIAITQGIEISVDTKYLSQHSLPRQGHYFFAYFITITNKSEFSVQLLKRHWDITDAYTIRRAVDGEGVVGETPVIESGQSYSYNSGCDFETEIGRMSGYYTMERLIDKERFEVSIPEFIMMVPAKLN